MFPHDLYYFFGTPFSKGYSNLRFINLIIYPVGLILIRLLAALALRGLCIRCDHNFHQVPWLFFYGLQFKVDPASIPSLTWKRKLSTTQDAPTEFGLSLRDAMSLVLTLTYSLVTLQLLFLHLPFFNL